jgi:uncharacterized protein YegL
MRLKTWEIVLLVLATISLAIFGLARTIGARASSREDIFTRIARPGVAFWGESVDVELRIDARQLPTCADAGDVSPVQAALVIDQSGSMSGAPLQEARYAASDFVDLMDLQEERDSVAIVSFDDVAYLRQPFTYERNLAVQAIQSIREGGGTDIAAGLLKATQELAVQTVTIDTRQVIILLSDGQSDPSSAIAAADAAKVRGIWIFTIALGDADRETLAQIASTGDAYYEASDPTALLDIYSDIAAGIVGTVATDIAVEEYFNDQRFDLIGSLYRAAQSANQINWNLPFMGARGRSVGYLLQPHGMGWHQVSATPGQMSLLDCHGQAISQSTPVGPRVLVIFPIWLLFPAPALALLWLLYRIIQALQPQPKLPVVAPGRRDSVVASKPKKQKRTQPGSDITHGRPARPPKRK